MRKFAILLAALSFTGPAFATNLAIPVRASPLAPPPAWSWTGFYVGGNVGYGWGSARDSFAMSVPLNGGGTADLAASSSHGFDGVLGGLQIGYNWDLRPLLLGFETDIQTSDQRGTGNLAAAFVDNAGADPTSITSSARLEWFGTVRARAGVILADRWLFYLTGGLAYGKVDFSGSAAISTSIAAFQNPTLLWNNDSTHVGWTIGAGIENSLSQSWSWKIEYLYMDLGSATATTASGTGNFCFGRPLVCSNSFGPVTGSIKTSFTDNILRLGANYKF